MHASMHGNGVRTGRLRSEHDGDDAAHVAGSEQLTRDSLVQDGVGERRQRELAPGSVLGGIHLPGCE